MTLNPWPIGLMTVLLTPAALANPPVWQGGAPGSDPVTDETALEPSAIHGYQIASDGITIVALPERESRVRTTYLPRPPKVAAAVPVLRPASLPDRVTESLWAQLSGPPNTSSARVGQNSLVITAMPSGVEIPQLPSLIARSDSKYPEIIAARTAALQQLGQARHDRYRDLIETLEAKGCNGVRASSVADLVFAECDLEDVRQVAQHPDVRLISDADQHRARAHGVNADPSDDPIVARSPVHVSTDDVREQIQDPYPWYIGVIDSGLNADHEVLEYTNTLALDCVNGLDEPEGGLDPAEATDASNYVPGCYAFDVLPTDPSGWNPSDCTDHGTPVAALLVGDDTAGDRHRGMTRFGLDSYKVSDGCSEFNEFDAVERAMAQAVIYNQLVNLSYGYTYDGMSADTDPHALLADGAYDLGLVVVASSGNDLDLECPGCAHKALTVGWYDIGEDNAYSPFWSSGWGDPGGGRVKPEVIGPANLELASASAPDAYDRFVGTSFAAPAVTAAAALSRALIEETTQLTEPGFTYATMMLQARGADIFDLEQQQTTLEGFLGGVGAVGLENSCAQFEYSKVTLTNSGDIVEIPITIDGDYEEGFAAAIWWPEDAGQTHNDIDLVAYRDDPLDPDYIIPIIESSSVGSVVEKVATSPFLPQGGYVVAVEAYQISDGPQEVYLAIRTGGCSYANEFIQP